MVIDDKVWNSVTHYVSTKKADGLAISHKILKSPSPSIAKALARSRPVNTIVSNDESLSIETHNSIGGERTKTSKDDIEHFYDKALRAKFSIPQLKQKLKETGSTLIKYPTCPEAEKIINRIRDEISDRPKMVVLSSDTPDMRDLTTSKLSADEMNLICSIIKYSILVKVDEGQIIMYPEMVEDVIYNFYPHEQIFKYLKLNSTCELESKKNFCQVTDLIQDEFIASEPSQKYSRECSNKITAFIQWLRCEASKKEQQSVFNKIDNVTIVLPKRVHEYRKTSTPAPPKTSNSTNVTRKMAKSENLVIVNTLYDYFLVTGKNVDKYSKKLLTFGGNIDEVFSDCYRFSVSSYKQVYNFISSCLSPSEKIQLDTKIEQRKFLNYLLFHIISLIKITNPLKLQIERDDVSTVFQKWYNCKLGKTVDVNDTVRKLVDESMAVSPDWGVYSLTEGALELINDQLYSILKLKAKKESKYAEFVGNFAFDETCFDALSIASSMCHIVSTFQIDLTQAKVRDIGRLFFPPRSKDKYVQYLNIFEDKFKKYTEPIGDDQENMEYFSTGLNKYKYVEIYDRICGSFGHSRKLDLTYITMTIVVDCVCEMLQDDSHIQDLVMLLRHAYKAPIIEDQKVEQEEDEQAEENRSVGEDKPAEENDAQEEDEEHNHREEEQSNDERSDHDEADIQREIEELAIDKSGKIDEPSVEKKSPVRKERPTKEQPTKEREKPKPEKEQPKEEEKPKNEEEKQPRKQTKLVPKRAPKKDEQKDEPKVEPEPVVPRKRGRPRKNPPKEVVPEQQPVTLEGLLKKHKLESKEYKFVFEKIKKMKDDKQKLFVTELSKLSQDAQKSKLDLILKKMK